MFLKCKIGGLELQIGQDEQETVMRRCSNCFYEGWTCEHPKAGECQTAMLYGGEFKHFKAKEKGAVRDACFV
jgi:hypothetical protein